MTTEDPTTIFTEILEDEGVPTTEEGFKNHFRNELKEQGSKIANTSEFSPFFLLLAAIVTKPALWIIQFLITTVMPNNFLKFAKGALLDILAWAYGLTRKGASKSKGLITFYRIGTTGDLPIPAGTVVESVEIDSVVYQMVTTEEGLIPDGQSEIAVPATAVKVGSAYNLAVGYYSILASSVSGITQVKNETGWLTTPGANIESDDDLRERCRGRWLEQSGWHTDATYKSIISQFSSVDPDSIYFDHTAPRGPYTANAYILLDVGDPAQSFLDDINNHINADGNHGHNDDLMTYGLPKISADITAVVTPVDNLTQAEKDELKTDVENVIQSAFRGNSAYEKVTRVQPFSQFSFSRLQQEIHDAIANCYSIRFSLPAADPISAMDVPSVGALTLSVS